MAFLKLPVKMTDVNEWLRLIAYKVNDIMNGKTNNTGTVTLTASAGSTTVSEAAGRIGAATVILFMPTTANAATEFGAGTMYVSARSVSGNTFTITHTNGLSADRTFYYVLVG
jgi:hypothetical protein